MISYLEIAKRIKDEEESNSDLELDDDFDFADTPNFKRPSFKFLPCSTAKGARKKWRDGLSKIFTFVSQYQDVRISKRCPLIRISTRGKMNGYIWGSHTAVGNAIKDMIEMGLIEVHDYRYRFNCGKRNRCRIYRFYSENVGTFIDFCLENNIKPYVIKEHEYDETKKQNGKAVYEFDRKKVLFKQNLKLRKPEIMGESDFKDFLEDCLFRNYPQLSFYKELVEGINAEYYSGWLKDLKIKFKPKFRWSTTREHITSIGIRAATKMNNTKRDDRDFILDEYGLDKRKDIRASVPRVTLSINNGEWFSKDIDLYKEIYKNCHQDEPFTDKMRDAIKTLFMRAYFDSTEKNMVNHTWQKMNQDGIAKEDIDEPMRKLRNAIKETCGDIYKKEIFLAESCIYLGVLKRLLESGRRCWLLYDCFYSEGFEGETDEEYSQIIDEYLVESFNEYMSRSKEEIR